MSITLFSQNGIEVKKQKITINGKIAYVIFDEYLTPIHLAINGDTSSIITEDMLLEVNVLITENAILIENVDSVSSVLEDCNEDTKINDKITIAMNRQLSTLEQRLVNYQNTINKLDADLTKSKKQTKIVGGLGIVGIVLGIIF